MRCLGFFIVVLLAAPASAGPFLASGDFFRFDRDLFFVFDPPERESRSATDWLASRNTGPRQRALLQAGSVRRGVGPRGRSRVGLGVVRLKAGAKVRVAPRVWLKPATRVQAKPRPRPLRP